MNRKVEYIGRDLEAMSFAINYHKWIFNEFKPFLGEHIVEVGAGTGAFSELLLENKPKSITLIEPSEMFNFLEQNVLRIDTKTPISLYQSIFTEVAKKIAEQKKVDSIVYVNVMEHIENDELELKTISDTLNKGGRCFIFVPALMPLYGEFDRKIGHFRRYTKKGLENKCKSAGFRILKSTYFDFAGIAPWFLKYRILKSDSLGSNAVTLYDKAFVPLIRKMEEIIKVPIGKNVLVIAEKI